MGQGDHRLHGHRVEDGGRNVLTAHVLGHQVLDIRLAEYPATRGYGVDFRAAGGQAIQFFHLHTQYDSHLVDEGTRAARTIAVHAQVLRLLVLEEDHLGVFPADVYQGLHSGICLADGMRGRHHLLHKRKGILFRHAHTDGARHTHGHREVSHDRLQLFQAIQQSLPDPRVVAHIFRV